MWTVIIKAALLALAKGLTAWWERWKVLRDQRKLGRLEVTVEQNTKAQEIEHEMAKVDASPASTDDVTNSLRDGKF